VKTLIPEIPGSKEFREKVLNPARQVICKACVREATVDDNGTLMKHGVVESSREGIKWCKNRTL
jgi:hypothetical protein